MPEFEASFVGPPTIEKERSPGGVRDWARIDAGSRVDAYVQVYRHLAAHGKPVTVAPAAAGSSPLGFSDEEVRAVLEAGVPFVEGIPGSGYRIESLAEVGSRRWRPLVVAAAATPVLLLLAVFAAGGGHGTPLPLILLFPFMALAWTAAHAADPPILLAVVQYPVYGAMLGFAASRRLRYVLMLALFLLHAAAAVAALGRFPAE